MTQTTKKVAFAPPSAPQEKRNWTLQKSSEAREMGLVAAIGSFSFQELFGHF